MRTDNSREFRVVVQYVHTAAPEGGHYAVVAYSGNTGRSLAPLKTQSLDDVFKSFRSAGINLDESKVVAGDPQHSYIVLADNFVLNTQQLALLGFGPTD